MLFQSPIYIHKMTQQYQLHVKLRIWRKKSSFYDLLMRRMALWVRDSSFSAVVDGFCAWHDHLNCIFSRIYEVILCVNQMRHLTGVTSCAVKWTLLVLAAVMEFTVKSYFFEILFKDSFVGKTFKMWRNPAIHNQSKLWLLKYLSFVIRAFK